MKVLKVAILAEKYATDYKWYVDVILNLIRLAGDYVSEEVRNLYTDMGENQIQIDLDSYNLIICSNSINK